MAKLLEKLRIEQTKSRSRHSNDNALAESKNASVVRKHVRYSHILQKYAQPINEFYKKTFNPWLNLHRPCMLASEVVSLKGKVVKVYRTKDVKTSLVSLMQLYDKGLARLKKGVDLKVLLAQANAQTDVASARAMKRGRDELFELFNNAKQRSA